MDRNHISSFFSDQIRPVSTRKRHDELHQPLLSEKRFLDRSDHGATAILSSERPFGDTSLSDDHYITALPDLFLPPGAKKLYYPQDVYPCPDIAADKSRTILRQALTLRQKSSWSIVHSEQTESKETVAETRMVDNSWASEKTTSCLKATDWIKRAASVTFGRRHRKSITTAFLHEPCNDVSDMPPMPPRPFIHRSNGAAARAAAAAQNELLRPTRSYKSASKDSRLVEPKITRDSESGIGIDLRDREEDTTLVDVPVSRLGQ